MTNGKVALVTGASRGIGRACAIKLGEAGYKVAVNYNSNEAAANEVVEKIKAAGSRCHQGKRIRSCRSKDNDA